MLSFGFTPFIEEPVFYKNRSWVDDDSLFSLKALKQRGEVAFEEYLGAIYARDDKDEFVNAFKDLEMPPDDDGLPQILFENMYIYDAVKCASEVIYHDRGIFKFDISDTAHSKIPGDKVSTPLHEAALHGAIDIINLLLDAQHSPSIRIHYTDPYIKRFNFPDVLPLELAMPGLCMNLDYKCLEEWAIKKSIFQLIALCCCVVDRKMVEIVRLLARKTTDLDHAFFKYMKDGKFVEMCVLLLAGCCPPSSLVLQYRPDILEKEKISELFEVFNTIGDKLSGYIRIKRSKSLKTEQRISEIASLFEDSGFRVKCEDIPSMYERRQWTYLFPDPSVPKKISVPCLVSPCAPGLALGGLSLTSKEAAPMPGVRQFHKATVPKAITSTGGNAFSHFPSALRRVGRLLR